MSISLYQLTSAAQQIQSLALSDQEGWEQSLSTITGEVNDKIVGCGMCFRNFQAEAELFKAESKRLAEIAAAIDKRAEKLREYVEASMKTLNLNEVNAGTFKAKWRKLPDMVEITDSEAIPAAYKKTEVVVSVSKESISKELKAGNLVSGARLSQNRRKVIFQ